jgi:hypothetical protein
MYIYIKDLRTMSQADVQARVDVEDAGARTFPVARVAVAKLGMYLYIYISMSVYLGYYIYIYIYDYMTIYT